MNLVLKFEDILVSQIFFLYAFQKIKQKNRKFQLSINSLKKSRYFVNVIINR
jgi:hypothetical protein